MITTYPPATELERDAGLTLVETLVLLAIVGMTLVLGATSWTHWREARRLSDAVEKVSLLVSDARTQARRTGKVVRVTVDTDRRQFDSPDLRRSVVLPDGVGLHASLANLDGPPSIVMLPDGSSTGGEISLTIPNREEIKLTVSWVNGEVRRAGP